MSRETLAIVGSGVAGLAATYFLKDKFDITLIEKNNYIGGHTNTIQIKGKQQDKPVDTGFMVFNEVTYPNFTKFLKKLSVPYYDTDMSFSVYDIHKNFEYNGSSLSGLFSQRKNLFNPSFIKMLLEIQKFSSMAEEIMNNEKFAQLSMADFINKYKLGKRFTHDFLIPMSSAVWSTPHDTMLNFPIKTLVRFFVNHGFLGLDTQHQWKTISGGSESYKKAILSQFNGKIILNDPAEELHILGPKKFQLRTKNSSFTFDNVILAAHADETLNVLKKPTKLQQQLLSPFKYQLNEAWVHTDDSFMPKIKSNWSSWNYIKNQKETFTVYWMNRLQPESLNNEKNIFININGVDLIDSKKVIKKITYSHPVFDLAAINAQNDLSKLNYETPGLYFCGSYFRYGFHEDAFLSALQMTNQILGHNVL
jgi:predicted NAD/FAD-binding protein